MPWRRDFMQSCWVDPDFTGLSGYPGEKGRPRVDPAGPRHVRPAHATYPTPPQAIQRPIQAAVFIIRDRTGFRYGRQVGLDDLVSLREAGSLTGLPIMTLTRWIKSGRLRSRKRQGFAVVRLRDLLPIAQARRRLRLGHQLVILG